MEKNIMTIAMWALFLGGLFGFAMGMLTYFNRGAPVEYGVLGIGGGVYLFWSAVIAFLKNKK